MCDADWDNSVNRKSISSYHFMFSKMNSPVTWRSRKQKQVALSTCNAEFVALSELVCECIWIQSLLGELKIKHMQYKPALIFCDNKGACAFATNICTHDANKHIDIKHYHVRDHIEDKTIILDHIPSTHNLADGYTKPLPGPAFNIFCKNLQNFD